MNRTDFGSSAQARPYLRSALAVLMFLRWGKAKLDKEFCYEMADMFLDQLNEDVQK